MLLDLSKKPVVPCAKCGKASEAEVWGFRVCYQCHSLWAFDEQFSVGAINGHLGLSSKPEDYTPAAHARYCAEATARTAAWCKERP